MKDKSGEPLSVTEKQIFGHDARRRPDGSIIEQGSSHDPNVVAHRAKLDEAAAASVTAEVPPREIDLRGIARWSDRLQ